MSSVKIEYIMYDSETDLPICVGNIDECARCVGVTQDCLRSAMHRYWSGERGLPRYPIYDIDKVIAGYYLEKEECHG